MRFSASTARIGSGAQRLPLRLCRRCYAHSGAAASSAGERAHGQQGFYSLGEYLQRLPRGIRDLLLWSPAIATAYFMLYKQAPYFLPSVRRQLLSRPLTTAPGSSGTDAAQRGDGMQAVRIRRDGASAGAVVDGRLLTLVDDGPLAAASALSPPIPPFSTGAGADATPLRVLRDAKTGKVSGYTAAG
ncbi:uncharacterized protein Tco025E_00919 [Trypanosoma conorhini]|uniref:Uncharacterized protein n=1 Tax=Trypanosoma conorhini TaxID=83891 RepID=A0A422QA69_9TRYP|nr:uncharacterized protein Tco025E_00919 [Trypanosoma conorhini]RNF26837.1 hypothetical protein Tco025E_00919 [Trypanosoma conorhini]